MSRYVGKRISPPAASPARGPWRRGVLVGAAGVTLSLVAWGVLVLVAIELGDQARSGQPDTWWWVAALSVAAVVCLFAALVLGARLVGSLTTGRDPAPHPGPPRVPGGRRAAR